MTLFGEENSIVKVSWAIRGSSILKGSSSIEDRSSNKSSDVF